MRVRASVRTTAEEHEVLWAVGHHLGALAGRDLAVRCLLGKGPKHLGRADRKRALTAECSSRWAGSITRDNDDKWYRAKQNLYDQRASLRRAISTIRRRLEAPAGGRSGRTSGYKSRAERHQKQRRLQHLQARLAGVEARIASGCVSVCRGGREMARTRHHLDEAGLTEDQWRKRWQASRLFLTADGDAAYTCGNGLIALDPGTDELTITLPAPLVHLSNTPGSRPTYRLSAAVRFRYRHDDWADQAAHGAVRYDLAFDCDRGRWYLDASWRAPTEAPALDDLMAHPVLAVDLNGDHLAASVITADGNPKGVPRSIEIPADGPTARRDGQLRAAISAVLDLAKAHDCGAVAIEDLNFERSRQDGRETMGRGQRGRRFRRTVAAIPTAKFRDRLVAMAYRRGIAVVAVDPAYTTKWGREHWLNHLHRTRRATWSVHHAATVVIGRRSLNHRPRRRRFQRRSANGQGVTVPHQRMRHGELPALRTSAAESSDPTPGRAPTAATRPGGESTAHRCPRREDAHPTRAGNQDAQPFTRPAETSGATAETPTATNTMNGSRWGSLTGARRGVCPAHG